MSPEVPGDIWLFRTTDGNWPGGKEDTETTTRILAAIKVETKATHSLRRGARSLCYRTTDGETVYGMEPQLHIAYGAPHVVRRLEGRGIGDWTERVADLTLRIERASVDASVAEITEAILLGESQEDEYFRFVVFAFVGSGAESIGRVRSNKCIGQYWRGKCRRKSKH